MVVVLLLLVPCASAQFSARHGNLKVRVTYTDDRAITMFAKVQLMSNASNNSVAEGFTDGQGSVDFVHVEVGKYHVLVTGEGIEDTDSGAFEVDERKGTQSVLVMVRRIREANPGATSKSPTIGAADLNIPQNARKEFDKAGDLINQQEWQKAIERLKRALALYPNYAAAYNNLAVAYGRLGDRPHEREALERAISINDHFAPAFVNLAKMDIKDHNLPEAETLLGKATAAEPTNPETLTLLANVELLENHYEQAILNCRKVHAIGHEGYAVVHYVAARALEHLNRLPEAVTELQTFLQEETSGARAEAARKELTSLQAHPVSP